MIDLIDLQVLTAGYWPTPLHSEITLTPELSVLKTRFDEFYVSKHQGRRLVWAHQLERCLVSASFPKGRKDLEVTLPQALVLCCFTPSQSRLTLQQLRVATGIEVEELKRIIQVNCGCVVAY